MSRKCLVQNFDFQLSLEDIAQFSYKRNSYQGTFLPEKKPWNISFKEYFFHEKIYYPSSREKYDKNRTNLTIDPNRFCRDKTKMFSTKLPFSA